ncbi:acid protease [Aaosphaeria arxii CBS 175.79]|uniref:Acid protease n=1 Tax=Aaosphaeria arxii CBS 175.79 TaxID=1450172 RepID=A0A6A5XR69_9PLEO|nr:acid protease [Aaosphaeria arxii CBS 175.79]KAF2015327.1 acid protease [Aaosphaeria arxii CBS 175.79]
MENPPIAAPLVFDASQEWDGNDGKWSSFVIGVGTPAQNFRVLPGIATGEILVPSVEACKPEIQATCGVQRGAFPFDGHQSNGFQANKSSTWQQIGLYFLDLRDDLNYTGKGLFGLERLGLMPQNPKGPTLRNQVVGAITAGGPHVGVLGLDVKPANFSTFDFPQASLMTTMWDESRIPSRSFGYTAGAHYRSPKVLGSLTVGGFDQERFDPNNITFLFDPDDSQPTSLHVQNIVAKDTLNSSIINLLDNVAYMQLDFTVPHLWLPHDVCDRFEQAFGLIYDSDTDLYRVNDSIHDQLLQKNPTVTIGLGTSDPPQRVNIELPYGAFDLTAGAPIYDNDTNYFPIRRANGTKYTLGRAFFQEAYIIVDYERLSFSVHQARFPQTNKPRDIKTIYPPQSLSTNTSAASTNGSGIPKGAVVGIVLGVSIGAMLLIAYLFVILKRRRTKRKTDPNDMAQIPPTHDGVQELHDDDKKPSEIQGNELHEMVGYQNREEVDGTSRIELLGDIPRVSRSIHSSTDLVEKSRKK